LSGILNYDRFMELLEQDLNDLLTPEIKRIRVLHEMFLNHETVGELDFSRISYEDIKLLEKHGNIADNNTRRLNYMMKHLGGMERKKASLFFF